MTCGRVYFDSFVTIGKYENKDPKAPWSTDDVLEEMDHCGIDAAMCSHNHTKRYDPAYGNMLLMKEIAVSKRLYPVWTVIPHHAGEMGRPHEIISQLKEHDVRCAKIWPKSHKYSFERWCLGSLMDALARDRYPVMLELDELSRNFDQVHRLLTLYPENNILLQGCDWSESRYIYPLMESCSNLYMEFSMYQGNGAIELMCRRFDPDRLLLGSRAPLQSMGASRAFIDYSRITEDIKRKIAGENLMRLTGISPQCSKSGTEDEPILAKAKQGLPLDDISVIDAHAHCGHKGAQGVGLIPMPEADIDHMLEKNRTVGIKKVFVSSWLGIYVPDDREGNNVTADAVRRFPEQVVGYATIDPTHTADINSEIKRAYFELGLKGLKPYVNNGLPFDHRLYTPWWEFANEHHLFALLHGGQKEAEILSEKYENVSFLLAHRAATFPVIRLAAELINKRSNVYAEITYTDVPMNGIELLVELVGAERVVFGTDAPMRDPRPQFGWLAYTRLNFEQKKRIFGENMAGIAARCRL